jgi:electron-transferring-flavoprotein dehydrogenase
MSEERDVLEVDVLFVGGGPAGLAGALHLTQLIEAHNRGASAGGAAPLGDVTIAVLEKASEIGAQGSRVRWIPRTSKLLPTIASGRR